VFGTSVKAAAKFPSVECSAERWSAAKRGDDEIAWRAPKWEEYPHTPGVYGRNIWLEVFFVSVASKGVSPAASLLFATLARRSIDDGKRETAPFVFG